MKGKISSILVANFKRGPIVQVKAHGTQIENAKPFVCPECDKVYPNMTGLNVHLKCVHKKAKDFACDRCPKTYFFKVWSQSSFELSCQLVMNDLNQILSVSLLMTSSTALANKGLFELTRCPSLTWADIVIRENYRNLINSNFNFFTWLQPDSSVVSLSDN